jgi:hypothetical protein
MEGMGAPVDRGVRVLGLLVEQTRGGAVVDHHGTLYRSMFEKVRRATRLGKCLNERSRSG